MQKLQQNEQRSILMTLQVFVLRLRIIYCIVCNRQRQGKFLSQLFLALYVVGMRSRFICCFCIC